MKLKKVRKQGRDVRDTIQLPYIYCFKVLVLTSHTSYNDSPLRELTTFGILVHEESVDL